jgi:hypothetical protein
MLTLYQQYSRRDVQRLFDKDYNFQPSRGTWGLHGVVRVPNRPNDWVFFVSYGQSQGGHDFDEGITADGVLTWQSQPRQDLQDARVRQWITQNFDVDRIYLFLRPNKVSNYYYLGNLQYITHDTERENPVWFQFQIQDFSPPSDLLELIKGGEVTSPFAMNKEAKSPRSPSRVTPPNKAAPRTSTRQFKAQKSPDFTSKEVSDKELGLKGELFVLALERERLIAGDREDLANKIVHISQEIGDGAGYDIASYNLDGSHRHIEVKTTRGGLRSGFYLTPNEHEYAKYSPDTFVLLRVFDFDPIKCIGDYYELEGDPEQYVNLKPVNYFASFS